MYAMLIRGEVQRRRGNLREALNHFRDAGGLADSWLVRFARGRAYVEAGAFAEAHAEIEACVSRRGEATDVFLDAVPTYRVSAPVQYYLGRAHEGLSSPESITAYNEFLAIKSNADAGDPLVVDARKRIAAK
jgi:tetratricopeptide (TPR) repeat protein